MKVDPRAKGGDEFIGVRLQYIPEFSMRWDEGLRDTLMAPGGIEAEIAAKTELLDDITRTVRKMDGVAYAETADYETITFGKESYDEVTDRTASGTDQTAGAETWFGRPIRERLEAAARSYEGEQGQVFAAGLPDGSQGPGALQSRGLPGLSTESGRTDRQGGRRPNERGVPIRTFNGPGG